MTKTKVTHVLKAQAGVEKNRMATAFRGRKNSRIMERSLLSVSLLAFAGIMLRYKKYTFAALFMMLGTLNTLGVLGDLGYTYNQTAGAAFLVTALAYNIAGLFIPRKSGWFGF